MPDALADAYDALPYPEFAFWFTHPDNLATMGRVFGLATPPLEGCRVLDVGCAGGGNTLPIAASLPDAEVVGVDVSGVQIAQARRSAAELGLDNVRFVHGDFRDLDEGGFDYVIAHGLFSWVGEEVRRALLTLLRERLSPAGVALVSYNTYPGWKQVEVARDLMRLHTEPFRGDPDKRLAQATVITDWLAGRARRFEMDWRDGFLTAESVALRTTPPASILHDYLADTNQPYYFRDFVALAAEHGLAYLADARPWDMWLGNYDADVVETLDPVPGLVRQAQYLDFVTNRRFRSTLLVRDDAPVDRRLSGARLEGLYLRTGLRDAPPLVGLAEGRTVRLQSPDRGPVEVSGAAERLALRVLWEQGRRPLTLEELWARVLGELDALGLEAKARADEAGRAELRARLSRRLVRFFFGELVSLSVRRPPVAEGVDERPRTGALQRWQAARGDHATNLWHEHFPMDARSLAILRRLDGGTDRATLASEIDGFDEAIAKLWRGGFLRADEG